MIRNCRNSFPHPIFAVCKNQHNAKIISTRRSSAPLNSDFNLWSIPHVTPHIHPYYTVLEKFKEGFVWKCTENESVSDAYLILITPPLHSKTLSSERGPKAKLKAADLGCTPQPH